MGDYAHTVVLLYGPGDVGRDGGEIVVHLFQTLCIHLHPVIPDDTLSPFVIQIIKKATGP